MVLEEDDINFRSAAKDGNVLKVLPHHSLLRVIRQNGDWLEAESDGVDGFIYAPYTVAGNRDELTQDDFALGYAALGQKFDEQEAEERLGAVKQEKIDKKRKQINYTFDGAESVLPAKTGCGGNPRSRSQIYYNARRKHRG